MRAKSNMPNRPIYMDNHATSMVDPIVLEAMLPYFQEKYGNASSITHNLGSEANDGVEKSRTQIAKLIGAPSKSVVFTSGATESNNIALFGVMRASAKRKTLVVNSAEHKAVLDPANVLGTEGFNVKVIGVDPQGVVSPDDVARAIDDDTMIVSVMYANNEVGTINDVEAIASICREHGVLFHTDATQAIGKIPISLETLPIDLVSFSAHKLYGPKGIGALYIRPGSPRIKLEPIMSGGGHERGIRSGTLPVPLIVGFGAACEIAGKSLGKEASRIASLRDDLVSTLNSEIDGVTINGHQTNRLAGNAHLSFDGVNSEALLVRLRDTVCLSTGSACTTSQPEPSHVLQAMGISTDQIGSSIRIGLGRFNTKEETTIVLKALVESIRELRRFTTG